jgi:hypothetical protein
MSNIQEIIYLLSEAAFCSYESMDRTFKVIKL